MRNLIISCIALGLAIPAAAAPRFGGGFGPRIGPRFGAGFGFGPAWGFGPGWGYSPYLYGGPATGGLKVETQLKDAAVYINGGYAGTVGSVKTLRLRPGAYEHALTSAMVGTCLVYSCA